nr:hypothetical protein [Tanacetum cinerariifolium]
MMTTYVVWVFGTFEADYFGPEYLSGKQLMSEAQMKRCRIDHHCVVGRRSMNSWNLCGQLLASLLTSAWPNHTFLVTINISELSPGLATSSFAFAFLGDDEYEQTITWLGYLFEYLSGKQLMSEAQMKHSRIDRHCVIGHHNLITWKLCGQLLARAHGLISLIVCAFSCDWSSCAGSELTSLVGSELTSLAGSELCTSSYRLIEDNSLATCEHELCPFGFLLASSQISSNVLHAATYRLTEDTSLATCEQELCPFGTLSLLILDSELQGSELDTLGTTPEGGVLLRPERPRTYDDLNDNEKKRFDADVCATNIMLQGLPKDIYKLINYNIEAKAIWDNVKMLLAGSELTKEDTESQLYDKFKRFKMLMGENINEYYVQFHKLDRFVTAVKLNKGLKETNNEQLYAYLKQHEKHVAQDRLIIERITPTTNDQLAFVSSVQPYTQSLRIQSHQYPPSSSPLLSPHVQSLSNFARRNGAADNGGEHIKDGSVNACQGKPIEWFNCNELGHIARNCTQPKRQQNSEYFKDKMLLIQDQENGAMLDEEELLFLTGKQINNFDADVDDHPVHDLENAIDSCDDNQDEHEIHNEVQHKNIIDSTRDHMGNCNVTPYEQYLSVNDVSVVPSCASSVLNDAYVLHDNDAYISHDPLVTELNIYKEQVAIYEQCARAQPTLYDGNGILKTHHVLVLVPSSEEDLELAETTRIKMNEIMNDHVCLEKRVKITPPNYFKENFMAIFTPQTQLTQKQVFWSKEINAKKADDLKARTLPLPVLPPATVYQPNTPVHLVPRTLPTTSQVNIEVRAMKTVFENLKAEVDQNAIDLKSGEIKRKNLLITNEILIANCIAQDVFFTVTDSAMTASRFHELSTA